VAASTFRARYSPGPSHTTLADATPPAHEIAERVGSTFDEFEKTPLPDELDRPNSTDQTPSPERSPVPPEDP
jgi:hypothetical protein